VIRLVYVVWFLVGCGMWRGGMGCCVVKCSAVTKECCFTNTSLFHSFTPSLLRAVVTLWHDHEDNTLLLCSTTTLLHHITLLKKTTLRCTALLLHYTFRCTPPLHSGINPAPLHFTSLLWTTAWRSLARDTDSVLLFLFRDYLTLVRHIKERHHIYSRTTPRVLLELLSVSHCRNWMLG
jgi:hypothetical protein